MMQAELLSFCRPQEKTPKAPAVGPVEITYDPAVLRQFLANLPDRLRANVQAGREFLREALVEVRVEDGDGQQTMCPVCRKELGNITPQHMRTHGLTIQESYRRFPGLGFNKKARLQVQPSPAGILRSGKVFGLMVAGAGFEPATFGL
ncbi:MAG: hypothetical protein ABSD47_20780 [Candidatus Methylomirabilota bacterium]